MTSSYSFIIPAYNEEKRIGKILDEMPGDPGQFIVVCDGNDSTADVVQKFSRSHPGLNLLCLEFSERLGKGGAVTEGFFHADAPVVGFMDADGSTSLDQMRILIQNLDGADVVIGSRWLPGSVIPNRQSFYRRVESRIFNLLIRLLFGLRLSDTQCGAKVFKKSAVDAVVRDMKSKGFEYDVELLWRLSKRGYMIREYPIIWRNMGDSRVKSGDALRMLTGLMRLRLGGGSRV